MTLIESVKYAKSLARETSENIVVNVYWKGYAVTYLLSGSIDGFRPRYIVTPEGFIFNYSDLQNSLSDFQRQQEV